MKTSTLLLGLLVATGCRAGSPDTANPGDAPPQSEGSIASKAPSEDAEESMSMDDVDMDEFRKDASDEVTPKASAPASDDEEDEDYDYDDGDEDYDDEEPYASGA